MSWLDTACPIAALLIRLQQLSWSMVRLTMNWYSAWLPISDAANRNPVLSTAIEAQGGMVSKYLTLTSVTRSPWASSVTCSTLRKHGKYDLENMQWYDGEGSCCYGLHEATPYTCMMELQGCAQGALQQDWSFSMCAAAMCLLTL